MALYRVGEIGYCATHRCDAVERVTTMGNPRARKAKPRPARHVPQIGRAERKELNRQAMRHNPTPAEKALRALLRAHPATKGRYIFQANLHGYVPDFLNRAARLIVEVDGGQHYTKDGARRDKERTKHLTVKGYTVIRFPNRLVMEQPQMVVTRIIGNH